jgi:uncharacterized protein YegL
MTDASLVHYIFIIDRSGSMSSIKDDMEGGIRTFIGKQLEGVDPAKRTISLYQFDTVHDTVYDFAPLEKAGDYSLVPRGGTALLDAIGFAFTESGEKLAAIPEDERPGYVMVVIVTDGKENSSKEYTRGRVKKLITHQQEKYNWKVTYIGANQDAFAEAGAIGIPVTSTLSYRATPMATASSWGSAGMAVSAGTVTTNAVITYTQEQREDAMKP